MPSFPEKSILPRDCRNIAITLIDPLRQILREWMKTDEAKYVFSYYGHLMTELERLAYRHLAGTAKATLGRTDADAQEEAKGSPFYLRELLSDEPGVLPLARNGLESFVLRTGHRILNDHRDQIVLNCCPRCSALARTPRAQQCRYCGHDWHDDFRDARG